MVHGSGLHLYSMWFHGPCKTWQERLSHFWNSLAVAASRLIEGGAILNRVGSQGSAVDFTVRLMILIVWFSFVSTLYVHCASKPGHNILQHVLGSAPHPVPVRFLIMSTLVLTLIAVFSRCFLNVRVLPKWHQKISGWGCALVDFHQIICLVYDGSVIQTNRRNITFTSVFERFDFSIYA